MRGGWYDAGDFNKYTIWTCNYIESLLLAYMENPKVFTDDYNIPESGNGVPDLLDEVKWGMDWVLRMQEDDGSVLCIQSLKHASPPSAATGQSVYGPATTMSGYSAAKAFILGYKVFGDLGMAAYADTLKNAATAAWKWAEEHPDVLFKNNDSASGTSGVGAGQQEVADDYDRLMVKMRAAMYLLDYLGGDEYKVALESDYLTLPLFIWSNFVQQYWFEDQMLGMRIQDMEQVDGGKKHGCIWRFVGQPNLFFSVTRFQALCTHSPSPACGRELPPGGSLGGRGQKNCREKGFPQGTRIRLPPGGSCREATEGERVPNGWKFQTAIYSRFVCFTLAYLIRFLSW